MFPCYTKEKGEIQMTAEYKNWQEDFVDINFTDQRLKTARRILVTLVMS